MTISIPLQGASPERRTTIFFFTMFMYGGAMNVYASIWLAGRGLSAEQIGWVNAVPIFIMLVLNAAAFAKNDMATMTKIWATDESLTIFESGHANYGWTDYRDNHLGPEMKEMKNTKYEFADIRAKVAGQMAYATMKYTISGDSDGKHFDSAGLATAVLEKSGGKWRIVHWHSSAPRRQPSPTPTPVKKS